MDYLGCELLFEQLAYEIAKCRSLLVGWYNSSIQIQMASHKVIFHTYMFYL